MNPADRPAPSGPPRYSGAGYSARIVCESCGASMPSTKRDLHTAWHAYVDEHGTAAV